MAFIANNSLTCRKHDLVTRSADHHFRRGSNLIRSTVLVEDKVANVNLLNRRPAARGGDHSVQRERLPVLLWGD